MTEHYVKVCTRCGAIIAQCRCDSKDKLLVEDICEKCKKEGVEKEDEIIENIKKGCSCKYCHGSLSDGVGLGCACTQKCKTLTSLLNKEKIALKYFSSKISTPHEALAWLACANLAKEIELNEQVLHYGNMGIMAYEKIGYFHDAKKWSEIFGFTKLVEYYQKLIDLKASRPK